ncbi:MAG: HD domain-containing protein [Clostridia bacterium]|nr:HD domain-containing protein [Clostridia bacterium]
MALLLKTESKRQTVLSIASKYNFEEKHALFVEKVALQIFDLLQQRFKLRESDRNLLSHACILHDIGNFINDRSHHKYSKFLVENDEGLDPYNDRKRYFLALIVFNHRKKLHKKTMLLSQNSRDIVLKLSAILRIADALDHTRENLSVISMDCHPSDLIITIDGVMPEKIIDRLNIKKALFCEVFKLDISLKTKK